MTNRARVKNLNKIKSSIQKYLFEVESNQLQKDEIISELHRMNEEIKTFRGREPDEKADITEMEFNSKISDVWLPRKKKGKKLSNSL